LEKVFTEGESSAQVNIDGGHEADPFFDAGNAVPFLSVGDFMGHDVGQFVIIHAVKSPFVHTEDSAQTHEGIDVFVGSDVYIVGPLYGPRISQVFINVLDPVVRFGGFIDSGLLLALGQKLHAIVIIQIAVVIGNKGHGSGSVQDFLPGCRCFGYGHGHTGETGCGQNGSGDF